MKKRTLALLLAMILAFGLAACGSTAPTESAEDTEGAVAEETEETEEAAEETDPAEDDAADAEEAESSGEPTATIEGNTITIQSEGRGKDADNDSFTRTSVMENYSFDYAAESGPIVVHVTGIEMSNITFKDEAEAGLAGVSVGNEAGMVCLEISVENTSDQDIDFYPDQSVIVTNTKEQIDSAVFVSDDLGGTYLGQVRKEGYIYFFCSRSLAEELTHLQWRIDAPYDADGEDVGEDMAVEFEVIP